MKDLVVLVDEQDSEYGSMEKYKAHKKGRLHRAFSIFIINDKGQLLLQKRAGSKYHSAGLWSNTCCSHPRPGEKILSAARRRLVEEMGFDCKLTEQFSFIYKTTLNNTLTEYEFDHVFFGIHTHDPSPDPLEVSDWKWMGIHKVTTDLIDNGQAYTYWFSHIWDRAVHRLDTFMASETHTIHNFLCHL